MEVNKILTQRNWCHTPSMQIVYEWEDEMSRSCGWALKDDKALYYKRYYPFVKPFLRPWISSEPEFQFVISPHNHQGRNCKNITPLIIDFFYREGKDLDAFYRQFDNHPLVLVSSKEVFDYLKIQNCPLNIKHCALSLPDKYAIDGHTCFEKKYDIMLFGRYNPVLKEFALLYKKENPALTIVMEDPREKYRYITSEGDFVGFARTREEYWNLMKATRIGLYSTPAIDATGAFLKRAQGYNQVTPKFLEYLACGCHIIARYPKNADTDYYELSRFSPHIETYEEFREALNKALTSSPDMSFYANYLNKHYTSCRATQIANLLKDI